MAFTRDELDETIRGAILELAKAAALSGSSLYPNIQRLKGMHEQLELLKTAQFRADQEREEIRQRDERVRAESARREYEEALARQAAAERSPYVPKWAEVSRHLR